MTTQYVDAFYWEYGYAEGDLDLQIIEASPCVVVVTAQGALGSVQPLASEIDYSSGALAGAPAPNKVRPSEMPASAADAASSASLEVVRLLPIAGAMTVSVTSTATLSKTVSFGGALEATTDIAASVALSVPLYPTETSCQATAQADLLQLVNMSAAVSMQADVAPAPLGVYKPFVASGDAIVNTIAVALLGKRLDGLGSVACVVAAADAAIGKAMASSLAVVTSASATAQVGKRFSAAAQSDAVALSTLALGKPIEATALGTTMLSGNAVLLRFVPVEIADRATYTLSYSPIYVDAVVDEGAVVEMVSSIGVTVDTTALVMGVSYTEICVAAELVEDIELEAQW